jgi:hypothetical protein
MATKLKSPLNWQLILTRRTRLLVEKRIFVEEEFWEMVRVMDQRMKRKKE